MKLKQNRIIQSLAAAVIAAVILSAAWGQGWINLPPKLIYTFRLMHYKIASGKIHGKTTVNLDVPFHKQEHSLSCEVAALKMALSVVGVNVSESELIKNLIFDSTPKQDGIWGDPDKGFVGSIDGRMPATGYGVYADPIAKLANTWVVAEVMQDQTPEALATHLLKGHPIIVWGFYGRGKPLSWTTPEGKKVKALNGEHARTVIGFTGDVQGPDGFYLIDPIFGPLYWKTDKFLKNWDALERMAVVVYPEEFKLKDDKATINYHPPN